MAAKVKLPRTRRSYYRKYQSATAISRNAVGVELTKTYDSTSRRNIAPIDVVINEKNGFTSAECNSGPSRAPVRCQNERDKGCTAPLNGTDCDLGGICAYDTEGSCSFSNSKRAERLCMKNGIEDDVDMSVKRGEAILGSKRPACEEHLSTTATQQGAHSPDVLARKRLLDIEDDPENKTSRSSSKDHSVEDSVDHIPAELTFTWLDVVIYFISIGSYIADVGSDLWVSYLYFTEKRWWWFGLTLGFVIVPSLITTTFSLTWYIQDHQYHKKINSAGGVGACRWVSRLIFHTLQLGPVLRYFDTMVYGWKSRKLDPQKEGKQRKHWYELMLYEDTDSALLRLFECFMEAAPQLTLQLYIMCRYGPTGETTILVVGQGIACVTSLASLSFALTSYHRALRFSLDDKANLGYLGMFMQFLWRFFTIGARVLAMALFATQFTYWVFVLAGCHWGIMLIWVLAQHTNFCHTKWQEFLFNIVAAAIYIFCYLNLVEGHTRLRYILYYGLVYGENLLMILGWWIYATPYGVWYRHPAIIMVCAGFFIGVFFQVLYYTRFHPNNYPPYSRTKKIKLCLSWSEMRNKPQHQHQLYLRHRVHSETMEVSEDDRGVVEVMIAGRPMKTEKPAKDVEQGDFV